MNNKAISDWMRVNGKKGGLARKKKLTTHRRKVIAQAAANKRWAKKPGTHAIDLLDKWLADESGYDEESWPELKLAIDRNRLSSRSLFDA